MKTSRLSVFDSKMIECVDLQKICDSWDDKEIVEGHNFEPNYIYNCLTKGDLPPIPKADKSSYRLLSIRLTKSGQIIGFTDLYYGYPTLDSAWISIFIIHKDYRNRGFAQEVIENLSIDCKLKGFKKIGIGVYLKNWRALRFWIKVGFDKITSISGDYEYSEDAFARMGLEKILK